MPKARHSSAGNSFFSFCRFFSCFFASSASPAESWIQDSRFKIPKKKESQALSLDEGSLERGSGFKQFCSQSWTLNPRTFAKFAQVTAYYCANCFITHGFSGTHKMRHHIYVYVHTRHTHMYTHTYTYTHVALHYIALHCIALHYATLHFSTLHYTTPHYITLHCIALHTYIYIYIYKPGYHRYRHTCKTWRFWQQGVLGGRRTSVEPRTKNQDYTESLGEIGSWFLVWWRS